MSIAVIQDAVVLAGGFGTRLASVVSDVPKPMAPVAGRPFLELLLDRLIEQGITRVVLAVGHKREVIQNHFREHYRSLAVRYSIESEPLGTGGALRQAFEENQLQRALALNGDTYCTADLGELGRAHVAAGRLATLTLVPMEDAGRYGAVELDGSGRVATFCEKNPLPKPGLINAGVYALERGVFELASGERKFSFEQSILQAHAASAGFAGHIATDALFIDIGIPDDYRRAQTLLTLDPKA
ncbi:MAG: nucleotidyltransferase family protein [Pseudomonadota bacterium]